MLKKVARNVSTARTCGELCARVAQRRNSVDTANWVMQRMKLMGPTFVKIGQFVSLRNDVIGDEVATILGSLRDNVNPLAFEDISRVLAEEGLGDAFDSVTETPIASASIAQVHAAVYRGRKVVIKVKRPNLEEDVRDDVEFLKALLGLLSRAGVEQAAVEWPRLLDEFSAYLYDEMDFTKERENLQAFARLYRDDPKVVVPRVHADASSRRVLTMDYKASSSLLDFKGDRSQLSNRVMATFISQLLYDGGIVHGDPHAGNIGIDARGRLVLYDFGSAIRIDAAYRSKLKLVIISLISSDAADTVRALQNLGIKINDAKLAEAYMSLYYKYVRTIDVNVFRPAADAGEPAMVMPFEFDETLLRLFRVFGMLEGICKELNSTFDYFEIMSVFWDAFLLDAEFVRVKGKWDLGAPPPKPPAGGRAPRPPASGGDVSFFDSF